MKSVVLSTWILPALLLAACSGEAPPQAPAEVPAPAGARPPEGPVDATYLCDGGHRVDLVGGRAFARVAMSDGRVARLGSIGRSEPPTWSDVGLRFVVGSDYVELSQDGGQTLRCEQQAPEAADPDAVAS
ncbi:hypothetical protein [Luteimonas huabeiensis]|uniref:hypothetical protein n=1 Tax=Luteimonas huabeiensis TaxID=1244513 RepID=UPI0004665A5E|nr:hypothetical protein [Luteimonas huabeiensis]